MQQATRMTLLKNKQNKVITDLFLEGEGRYLTRKLFSKKVSQNIHHGKYPPSHPPTKETKETKKRKIVYLQTARIVLKNTLCYSGLASSQA